MNQNNQQNFSLRNKKRLKKKNNGNYRLEQWLKLKNWKKFSYVTTTAFIFTIVVTFLSPAWLSIGQSVAHSPLSKETNEIFILAQEESAAEEATTEEATTEESAEGESAEGESAEGEELPFEEAKKSLEEEIDERYEEWESQKTTSEISHSISAIAVILMTVIIIMLGGGVFELPYKRLIIFILGAITILIQLNINVFLLDKTLGGYEILAEQGSILKTQLEDVKTNEELTEVREKFQELVLESTKIE